MQRQREVVPAQQIWACRLLCWVGLLLMAYSSGLPLERLFRPNKTPFLKAVCCGNKLWLWVGQGYSGSEVKVAQLCRTLQPHGLYSPWNLQARILEWVVFPFSRGSSQSRDGTQVSRIAGGFFTSWATREALLRCLWKRPVLWCDPGEPSHMAACPPSWAVHTIDPPRVWHARIPAKLVCLSWGGWGQITQADYWQTTPALWSPFRAAAGASALLRHFQVTIVLSQSSQLAGHTAAALEAKMPYSLTMGHFLSQRPPGRFAIYLTAACSPWIFSIAEH